MTLLLLGALLTIPAQTELGAARLAGRLVRVVDGDTVRLDLDLGADVTLRDQAIRILGIDAPEMHGPDRPRGIVSKRGLEELLARKHLEVELHDKDKYGRWLADLWADGENVGLAMIKAGLAVPYQIGRGRRSTWGDSRGRRAYPPVAPSGGGDSHKSPE